MRDVFFYSSIATLPILVVIALFLPTGDEISEGAVAPDTIPILLILFCGVADVFILRWRIHTFSSVLSNGEQVPGKITNIIQLGDSKTVEFTNRFQGQEYKSTKMIGGIIPRKWLKPQVGQEVTLLVDSHKPMKFLVLDMF